MTTDPHHYPADLMALLIETIPKLCRSKDDVLLFFHGAGVSEPVLAEQRAALAADRDSVRKTAMTRVVLTQLNDAGYMHLRALREVVRRVEEWEDFSTCWPADRLPAAGLVAEVRRVRNVKDSFTRLQQEKSEEERRHRAAAEASAAKAEDRRRQLREVRNDLGALFAEQDAAARGKKLEGVLNRLFEIEELTVRESFTIVGAPGEGVVEQIDGVVTLDGELYLVEMKWTSAPVGVAEVSRHLIRVFGRGCARGIFISSAGFTDAARAECQRALTRSVFVLCELQELVTLLEQETSLPALFRKKVEVAVIDRDPLFRPLLAG